MNNPEEVAKMIKITIIGAGSTMFARQLLSAIFSYPELRDVTIMLEDLNEEEVNRTATLAEKMVEQEGISAIIEKTTDQKEAVRGADFVISTIQVGGDEPWILDREIPKKYGIDQEAGDTLGPGGVFRGLRHIPATVNILRDMEKECPDALFINYANPMAAVTWAANDASKIHTIGLCYGVPFTITQIAGYLKMGPWLEHPWKAELWDSGINYELPENVSYFFGGINHMTWILKYEINGEDLYPKIRKMYKDPKVYEADGVRCEILKHFGYWSTENHWHFSDYVPYFRKNEDMINRFIPRRWNLIEGERKKKELDSISIQNQIEGKEKIDIKKNMFNAPKIIHAKVSGQIEMINGNVKNIGLIQNLPAECVVEVPVYVDKSGLHPVCVGKLPPQCAALNRTNINVQSLIVEAALNGDKDAARQAIALDPLTSAVCTLDDVEKMFDEMFEAERKWLPEFE